MFFHTDNELANDFYNLKNIRVNQHFIYRHSGIILEQSIDERIEKHGKNLN